MIDMLSKVLKKKFESGPMKIEIHMGKDDVKGSDLAPEVKDQGGEDQEMNLLQQMVKGESDEAPPMDRKPTMMEQAKGKMKARMAEKNKKR